MSVRIIGIPPSGDEIELGARRGRSRLVDVHRFDNQPVPRERLHETLENRAMVETASRKHSQSHRDLRENGGRG
jgi:hypothetical protein